MSTTAPCQCYRTWDNQEQEKMGWGRKRKETICCAYEEDLKGTTFGEVFNHRGLERDEIQNTTWQSRTTFRRRDVYYTCSL